MSDTKANKLAWRRLAMEFLPNNSNMVQFAFQVKTAYYKNLAWVGDAAAGSSTDALQRIRNQHVPQT
jgi:hypothetical protein